MKSYCCAIGKIKPRLKDTRLTIFRPFLCVFFASCDRGKARLLCMANVTKLFVLNMFAHEANVSKPKL